MKKPQTIKEYYEEAWKCITKKDIKGATKILYFDMPQKLYDMSINILYNSETKQEELQHLIKKVDNALIEESMEEESELSDEYNGNF